MTGNTEQWYDYCIFYLNVQNDIHHEKGVILSASMKAQLPIHASFLFDAKEMRISLQNSKKWVIPLGTTGKDKYCRQNPQTGAWG